MRRYVVNLESEIHDSFRCKKAADSINLNISEKSKHSLAIDCDLDPEYNIGLIVGSSGSGKTTLAREIFGKNCLDFKIDFELPVIDQFPESFSYDDCVSALAGMGLTSIPCWLRPVKTLSTGQLARAEASLRVNREETVVIDEWTSVVDRDVAKVMSHCVQKFARRKKKKIVLLSCHRDVEDWLNPDWVIDCNTQTFKNRRSMVDAHVRGDRLRLDIRTCSAKSWHYFSKYHYLSDKLPGGKLFCFGLFRGADQIGFNCFANYSFTDRKLYHSNRVVIHPDFIGFGLGVKLATECSRVMHERGYRIKAKFTSPAMYRHRKNHPNWKCTRIQKVVGKRDASQIRSAARIDENSRKGRNAKKLIGVKYYFFDFVP